MIEIAREHKAQHQTQPNRHVRVTTEIEVNLKCIIDGSKPGIGGTERRTAEGRVCRFGAGIRQNNLLGQTQ
jgi:hypothetical protein